MTGDDELDRQQKGSVVNRNDGGDGGDGGRRGATGRRELMM